MELQNHTIEGKQDSTHEQGLISMLQDIQNQYGYLPEKALRTLADRIGRSLVDLYGIATFYKSFRLKPRGKHFISACLGTACHVRGAPSVADEFRRQLHLSSGETTADGEFTFETVNCLGACALGPIAVVDGRYFPNVNKSKVGQIIHNAKNGLDKVEIERDQRIFPVMVSCPRCNHNLMDQEHPIDGHPSIRVTISFENQHGALRLSSLYGSYSFESEYNIPMKTKVNFFCPHCHSELIGASNCPECGAHMVPMAVVGGAMVQICSRRGCRSHMLDLDGVNF